MLTNPPGGRHNDGVTPRRAHAPLAVLAVLAALALVLTGCGAEEQKSKASASPSADLPTGNVEVPEGVDLTKAGTTLDFGEPATVAYEPNSRRSSVLSVTVESVKAGQIKDFAAYQLDKRTSASKPYYVRVSVKNVGTGDLSRAGIPLLALDSRNTLIQSSSFNNTFEKCPSTPLPAGFVADQKMRGCLVYLVPEGGKLTGLSFRPLQAFEPIVWKGEIEPAKKAKKAKAEKKKATKNKKKKKAKS